MSNFNLQKTFLNSVERKAIAVAHLEKKKFCKYHSLRYSSTMRMQSKHLFMNPTLDRLLGSLPPSKATNAEVTDLLLPLGSYYGSTTILTPLQACR